VSWQKQLQQANLAPRDLLQQLNTESIDTLGLNRSHFPLRTPSAFVQRIEHNNPQDPLLRQILPLAVEQQTHPDYQTDPVGDQQAQKNPALLHKYQGRALLLLTGACAIHCRYCFRQHYDYQDINQAQLEQAYEQIAADSSLTEIILSGGDPLILSNQRLQACLQRLNAIPHLKNIRIHSRIPVVLPDRLDDDLLALLANNSLPITLVIHANHAQELDNTVQHRLHRLRQAGIWLFNQSVLLRGVNDTWEDLVNLSQRLADCQVVPYYLHLLDKVQGASHFDVPEAEAIVLMQQLRSQLPGYLVPRLVREVAGMAYKQPV